jgi:hypothetical protein
MGNGKMVMNDQLRKMWKMAVAGYYPTILFGKI